MQILAIYLFYDDIVCNSCLFACPTLISIDSASKLAYYVNLTATGHKIQMCLEHLN